MIILKKIKNKNNIKTIILIVTYNTEIYVKELLESIANQDYDMSRLLLLIIDNNSLDNTVNKIIEFASKLDDRIPNIILVRLGVNVGFAPANNIGLKLLEKILGKLSGKYLILLNPDTKILDKKFLRTAEMLVKRLPIVGFATISIDTNTIDSLGAYVDMFGNPQDILHKVKLTNLIKNFLSKLPQLYTVPYVCFATVALRGNVFERLGLLRDEYVIYFDDSEFSLRAWSNNVPVIVYRNFLIHHARGGSKVKPPKDEKLNMAIEKREKYDKNKLDVSYHFSKNSLLFAYEYLGPLVFIFKVLLYLFASILFKRKYLVYAIITSLRLISVKRLKWRRLPKGLIEINIKTSVLFWTFKYYLYYNNLNKAVSYGVKKASLEYLINRFISKS